MTVYQWICVLGIPTLISGGVMLLINRSMAKRDATQKKISDQSAEIEKQNTAMMAGMQALLRDRLLQGYLHYEQKGWADYEDRQNMCNLYTSYHNLGANGVMDQYKRKFDLLPDKPTKEGIA